MKITIVLNGISLEKKFLYHEVLPALRSLYDVDVCETRSQNDAILLASKAVEQGADIILAAGGDGTVHQVLNGILNDREESSRLPVLGIIPIGSGNDFARALSLKDDPSEILRLLKEFKPKKLDVGRITYRKNDAGEMASRYFINEADIGMGPEVVRKVLASGRPFGSGLSYYWAIVSTFFTFKPYPVKMMTENWNWEGMIRSLAIANGKYYGHGLCISPDSKPDDGKFGTFICSGVSVFDFIRFSNTMKKGKHIRIPEVIYNEAQSVELVSSGSHVIEADGEILGFLPAKIEMLEKKISVLC